MTRDQACGRKCHTLIAGRRALRESELRRFPRFLNSENRLSSPYDSKLTSQNYLRDVEDAVPYKQGAKRRAPRASSPTRKIKGSWYRRYKARCDCRGWRPRQPGSIPEEFDEMMGEYVKNLRIRPSLFVILCCSARAAEGHRPLQGGVLVGGRLIAAPTIASLVS